LWDMTHSFVCTSPRWCTWLIHMYDMTYSYVWHDPFICVTWPIHTCNMTHTYVWHVPFICVTWPIHLCAMSHSYTWHDSFIWTGRFTLMNECNFAHMRHTHKWVMSHFCHAHESVTSHFCHTHEWVTSWMSNITYFYMIDMCDINHTSNIIYVSRTWMSNITYFHARIKHMNKYRHTCLHDSYVRYNSFE